MGYVTRKDLEAAGVVIPDGSAPWSPPWLVPPPVSKPKASATGPTPEKPRELAAGQVWELTWEAGNVQRFVLTWPHYAINGAWHFEGGEGGIYVTSETILGGRRIRYLGTKEEVAARERDAKIRKAAEDLEATGLGSADRNEAAIRKLCKPEVTFQLSATGGKASAEEVETLRTLLDCGLERRSAEENAERVGVALAPKPDPYPNAALHRAIDDAIAADFGPFAHARAAALRAWSETDAPAWVTATPREMLVMLRVYENIRGGQCTPSAAAIRRAKEAPSGLGEDVIAVYERERSRSPVHGRRE